MKHKLLAYAQELKRYLLEHGNSMHDTLVFANLSRVLSDRPLLTEQLIVGKNLHQLRKLDMSQFRKQLRRLNIDLNQTLQMYKQVLLRWEALSQSARLWSYVEHMSEEARQYAQQEYMRGVETLKFPSLQFRSQTDQVLFNNCVLPITSFELQDLPVVAEPAEFSINTPGYNIQRLGLKLFGATNLLLFDLHGTCNVSLEVYYETELHPWTYRATQSRQLLFKPDRPVRELKFSTDGSLRAVYQLTQSVEPVEVTYNIAKPHIQPKSYTYQIDSQFTAGEIRCFVTGLQSDTTQSVSSTGTLNIDLSSKDQLSFCVLYGKYDPTAEYLTGQHRTETGFVQYGIWDGSSLPDSVTQYTLHSLKRDSRPSGLCVFKFSDPVKLAELNQKTTTYQYLMYGLGN